MNGEALKNDNLVNYEGSDISSSNPSARDPNKIEEIKETLERIEDSNRGLINEEPLKPIKRAKASANTSMGGVSAVPTDLDHSSDFKTIKSNYGKMRSIYL